MQNATRVCPNHDLAGLKLILNEMNDIYYDKFDYTQSALMQMFGEPAWLLYAIIPFEAFLRSMALQIGVQSNGQL
jgi:hypothetical protein